jgi:hypothetical protein
MSKLIGLPSEYFADEEILGAKVRLRFPWNLDDGHSLYAGEIFDVIRVYSNPKLGRQLHLSNHRAEGIPVRAPWCELLFEWPSKARGIHDGGK